MILFYFLIAWTTLGVVLTVAMVGKPRQPTTAGVAAGTVFVQLLIIVFYPR
jgi:hypothetical protein